MILGRLACLWAHFGFRRMLDRTEARLGPPKTELHPKSFAIRLRVTFSPPLSTSKTARSVAMPLEAEYAIIAASRA
jgi:hypothetical protein